jgi:hypothetical protein
LEKELLHLKKNPKIVLTSDRDIDFIPAEALAGDGGVVVGEVVLFMAADFLQHCISLGKEGMAPFWCIYCKLSKTLWQLAEHNPGEKWTIDELIEKGQEAQAKNAGKRHPKYEFGQKRPPAFTAIEVNHYIPPLLHYMLGRVNDGLEFLQAELQAAAEKYTEDYVQAEKKRNDAKTDFQEKSAEMAQFNKSDYPNYMKQLKRRKDRYELLANPEDDDSQEFYDYTTVCEELTWCLAEQKRLKDAKEAAEKTFKAAQAKFDAEGAKPENSKVHGQPLREKIEEFMDKHEIKRAKEFGGKLTGPNCRKLIEDIREITEEIKGHVILEYQDRPVGTNQNISDTCDLVAQWLECIDGFVSILYSTKRFELTDEILADAKQFRDKILELERYLGVSITPKSHSAEDHFIELMELHQGFGDLDESFGEQNHQTLFKFQRRFIGRKAYGQRQESIEKAKAKADHPKVQEEASEMIETTSRKKRSAEEASPEAVSEKKQRRQENRSESLIKPLPTYPYTNLQEVKKDWLKNM